MTCTPRGFASEARYDQLTHMAVSCSHKAHEHHMSCVPPAAPTRDACMQAAADTAANQQQSEAPGSSRYMFVRQPAAFCTNCCTPLDPLRPAAACSACGHLPADDALLFSLGVSSLNELSAHTPPWLLQQQGLAAAAAAHGSKAATAAAAAAGGGALHSTAVLSQRIEAGMALQQARQLLQDAGILQLPATVLAWEDDQVEAEPAMQLHRAMLPPNHERPERLRVVLARLRAAGLLGEECGSCRGPLP